MTHFLAFLLGIASYHIALHALYRWIFRDNGTRQSGGGLDEMPDFV